MLAHHHAALTLSGALSRTFGGVGVFGIAHQQISALAEMQADDAVRPAPDRIDLARALLSLVPTALVSGSSARATERVRRLTERADRPRRPVGLIASTAGLAVLAAPLALALVPAVEAAARDCCPTAYTHLPTTDPSVGPLDDTGNGLRQNVIQQRP